MADTACSRCTNPLQATHPACPHCSGPKARKGDQGGLSLGEHLRALAVERIECSDCDGSGNVAARGHEPCWRCGGSGQVSQVDLQKLHDQIASAKADAQRAREEATREVAEVKAWGQRQADETRNLREAARELLADFENNNSDEVRWCEALGCDGEYACPRLATHAFLYDSLCDEHTAEHRAEHPKLDLRPRELSYAPALRRLRALVVAAKETADG